ncbi:DUF4145 domain-containing protein [Nonomuraea sp. NPDC050310]|uniref:DUF4145 domain-containing protein n=1 Tax=Nonomuraea sp. NPDC050310 TaxID=3154935 RepID=UPI0033F9D0C4
MVAHARGVYSPGFSVSLVIVPGSSPGSSLQGLPRSVDDAWGEARSSLGAGCYTASEIMCRKILMYVAVDKGEPAGKTFAHYLSALETQGYITPPMKTWVDKIRLHGNEANHELPTPDKKRAEMTLGFTEQLLRIVYEMEHLAKAYTKAMAAPPNVPGTPGTPRGLGGSTP